MHPTFSRRHWLQASSAAALGAALPAFANAGDYPRRAVHFVTWVSAGSNNDVLLRLITNHLATQWKQATVVENRVGATGIIGTAHAARAPADGYTVLMTSTGAQILNPLLKAKLPYDPVKDFDPVALLTSGVYVFVVPANSPYKSLRDFAEGTKSKPDGLTFGSWGPASAPHLMGENLANQLPGKLLHVPFAGELAVSTGLQGNIIDGGWVSQGTAVSMQKAGRLRCLAVTGTARNKALPDVPTFAETGFKNFEMTGWNGMYVPKGTPPEIIRKLADDLLNALKSPEVAQRIEAMGLEMVGTGPEALRALFQEDTKRWSEVVKVAGLKPE